MSEADIVGTDIGTRYRIERRLGQGGMGNVYEALDRQLKRRVAVKMMRHELDDDATRARFYREARAAAALAHPNACQLYEISEHEGQPFLVMELLDGEPLSARLARGPLSLKDAADVLMPLMDVVSTFHQQGLVHRDLKPSNVFLTERGVKLLDFGLARRTDRGEALTATLLTSPGVVTGTMRYMAPEQITGDPVDARADIFALGVLLFEMLTGRIPFDAATNVDWLHAVLNDQPPSLENAGLTMLDPIIQRALQRRPEDRYQSVERMAREFQAAFEGSALPQAPVNDQPQGVRIIVLPFRVPADDQELDPLRHGVPEALTTSLSSTTNLRLVSDRLAEGLGDNPDLRAVGKALGVDRLLTGSIQRANGHVRVTAQFVDAADGAVIWSQARDYDVETAIALQDDICADITAALPYGSHTSPHEPALSGSQSERPLPGPTADESSRP
jgi:eukaryotic-like serine/threonine-protein kinase